MKLFLPLCCMILFLSSSLALSMPIQEDLCQANGINYQVAKDFFVELQSLLRTDKSTKIVKLSVFLHRLHQIVQGEAGVNEKCLFEDSRRTSLPMKFPLGTKNRSCFSP